MGRKLQQPPEGLTAAYRRGQIARNGGHTRGRRAAARLATDAGGDSIGIALWSGNKLLHSSRWTGFSTLEQALAGGNLNVR